MLDQKCECLHVNVYIVYDLDTWPRKPLYNFKYKNCLLIVLFGTKI